MGNFIISKRVQLFLSEDDEWVEELSDATQYASREAADIAVEELIAPDDKAVVLELDEDGGVYVD